MEKIVFILVILFCPNVFAATLTANTIPYVCQGGTSPQLCNSNITTDSSGNIVSGSMFVPNNVQIFTSSGTWTKPAGVSKVYVKVIGAGGSGVAGGFTKGNLNLITISTGSGGGAGGYAEGIVSVTGNVVVTIGGTNSFAGVTTIQATSGGNGSGNTGGNGGVGTGGVINLSGDQGEGGLLYNTMVNNVTGTASNAAGGKSAMSPIGNGASGNNAPNPGAVIVYY